MTAPSWLDVRLTRGEQRELCDTIERRCQVTIRKRPPLSCTAGELLELLASQSIIGGDVSRQVELRAREAARDPREWLDRIAAESSTYRADGAAQERR